MDLTVREKMDKLLKSNPNLIDCGEFKIDYRDYGFLQDSESSKIISVYKSKDDIDNQGNPLTKTCEYDDLKEFMGDFDLKY